MTISALISVYL